MARAHAANACVQSDSIKGLAQSIAKPAYHRLLIAEPALRRAVPTLIIAFLITICLGAFVQVVDQNRQKRASIKRDLAALADVLAERLDRIASVRQDPGTPFERLQLLLPGLIPSWGVAAGRHVIVVGGPAPDGMLTDADIAAAPDSPPDVGDVSGGGGTMIYTSGTTGKPKGAVRYGTGATEHLVALLNLLRYRPEDTYITSGPLYHSGPGAFLGAGLLYGQTVIVQRKFDAEDWLRLVDKYRASSTFSAPALMRMICALPKEVKDRYDRSSMHVMIANAAPWSFELKKQYVANFPPESLFEVYGSTELGVDTVLLPEDQMRKPGSCGRPAPGIEIKLFDELGNPVTGTGPDHAGEVFVRSGGVFDAYYKNEAGYEANTRGDYHTVGDVAYWDDEGYLYICDRKSDMIISGGMNIYPAEIEAALERHPDIYDVAVFGIPSEKFDEAVHATVVRAPGSELTAEEVTAFAREHLAGYKVPRSVDFTDELPRTGSGKILKRQLRAPFWADHAGR